MKIDKRVLARTAADLCARGDMVEKVMQLLHLLNTLMEHPYLTGKWALKGGTALNLFVMEFPRLSVDIDVNYIGAIDRNAMLEERPKVEHAIRAVCQREGYTITREAPEHAGGKWRLNYPSVVNATGNLELDLNFMQRVPLWPVQPRNSVQVGPLQAREIPVLDIHELASGKLAALMARHASRDLYDAYRLLGRADLDWEKLRVGFAVYGGMSRTDWRTIKVSDIAFTTEELRDQLLPVIRNADQIEDTAMWGSQMVIGCQDRMGTLLPLPESTIRFLSKLNDQGKIDANLLTSDAELASRISHHPMLHWKAQNVRAHRKA